MEIGSPLWYILLLILGIATGFFVAWLRGIWKSLTE